MPAIALLKSFFARHSPRLLSLAAALLFAAFIAGKGIPTLRHDWSWPIDRTAVPSFASEAFDGWLSAGVGTPNPHPTTYLIALPIVAVMWLFGPLAVLAMLSVVVGYACMRCVAAASSYWGGTWAATLGIGLFALFNPWVYNEVVAGHLVMVLAYAGLIGLFAEMLHGRGASAIRLALWTALIEAQLQFFILAMLALLVFASTTRKWLAPILGAIVALPSAIGLIAERGTLLQIPYGVTWQANQSVAPLPLLGLSGYFPGYADRLGIAPVVAVALVLFLAVIGILAAWRHEAVMWSFVVAVIVYVIILGVHGPLALPYTWIVRNVPESGVFRELYDLAGAFAAFLALLACAATGRARSLGYVALMAGITLLSAWVFRPPGDLWVPAMTYPHPTVAASPFSRVALTPAFQPLGLRADRGDGADPDAHGYPHNVATVNQYFPSYPVDMALARYEQFGDVAALRALGVSKIIARPWLVSRMHGGIGFAAFSLQPKSSAPSGSQNIADATPLISQCDTAHVVESPNPLGTCDLFFADVTRFAIHPIAVPSDSIDPQRAWIDARLAFAEAPALAQAMGGALTQSNAPMRVDSNAWLLAYVRGSLTSPTARVLARSNGRFIWLHVPKSVSSVRCAGLCELVAETPSLPAVTVYRTPLEFTALRFRKIASWLYIVRERRAVPAHGLIRFNERYDPGWIAVESAHALRHVRVDAAVNGWFLDGEPGNIAFIQVTALLQSIAEIIGICCVLWLLKALMPAPTKRAR